MIKKIEIKKNKDSIKKILRDKIKKKQNQENDKKKKTTIKRMGIISNIKKSNQIKKNKIKKKI